MNTRHALSSRFLPSPLTSAALLLAWLMLNETASPGQWLLGALLALIIPVVLAPLRPDRSRLRSPLRSWPALLRLVGVVLWDTVRSNLDVARRVLGPEAAMQPRFLWVPLDLQDPLATALLAGIVTTTPGTISAELSEDRRWLLVHALHAPDDAAAAAIAADIKARYEVPLLQVFR